MKWVASDMKCVAHEANRCGTRSRRRTPPSSTSCFMLS